MRQAVLATRAGRADAAARAEAQRRQQPAEALRTERVNAGPMTPSEARRPIRFCRIAAPTVTLPGLTVPARETSRLSGEDGVTRREGSGPSSQLWDDRNRAQGFVGNLDRRPGLPV